MYARGILTGTVLLAVFLAGCVASEGGSSGGDDTLAPSATAEPGSFDETSGAVTGVVTDAELVPLGGADLNLAEADMVAKSAMDGTFSFSNVPPGEYTLLGAKLGYEAAATRVLVVAGEETSGVKVSMEPLAVVEPRVVLYQFKGYITCTIGYSVVLSEECGQGVATDLGTFGGNPNNKIDWKFNVEDVEDLQSIYLELDWQPASAAAHKLTLYVAHKFSCNPSCGVAEDGGEVYCGTDNFGPPVMGCEIAGDDLGVKDPTKDLPWDMTSRAWGAQVETTEVPNIVLEQSFEMYRTDFFGEAKPEGYSAVADA